MLEYRMGFRWDPAEAAHKERWGEPIWDLIVKKLREDRVPQGPVQLILRRGSESEDERSIA